MTNKPCCPTCGHTLTAPRTTTSPETKRAQLETELLTLAARNTDRLSDADVRAHYAKIGPFMDVRTFLHRADCVGALRVEAESLYAAILDNRGKQTPATKRAYGLLMQHWREASNAAQRADQLRQKRERVLMAVAYSRAARKASRYNAERQVA